MRIIFLLLFLSLSVYQSEAQENHTHVEHTYHLGVGISAAHLSGETGIYPGFHVHFLRFLGHAQKWEAGIGYESILGERPHHILNIPVGYEVLPHFTLTAAPGITFEKHNGATETGLAAHFEAAYEFELGRLHLGPLFGMGIDKDGSHFALGIHTGIGF